MRINGMLCLAATTALVCSMNGEGCESDVGVGAGPGADPNPPVTDAPETDIEHAEAVEQGNAESVDSEDDAEAEADDDENRDE